ncbi:NUDIX hydrolase [Altererythrobacter sp. GH1-8]|uniref:NUDIX hydrolase n=1 Tax=Altererythrobacter sp. GH1-8 TaxID=3349333 RepID=UPI00374D0658
MLHLIPPRAHRLGYRMAHAVRTQYWRIARPTVHGCAIITRNALGEVLLVQPCYGNRLWQWPGGGIDRDEDIVTAAAREVAEETGLGVGDLRLLGQTHKLLHGATNVVHIYGAVAEGHPRANEREILSAGWFGIDELPNRRSIYVDEFLMSYRTALQLSD